MSEKVLVDLSWIANMKIILSDVYSEIRVLELNTYDFGKAEALQSSMKELACVIKSLNVVVSNPEKYILKI